MAFRERLLESLRAMQPVLDVPGVMVGGSQVPNLLEPLAAATLVVSQDVDLVVPVPEHAPAKAALERVEGYSPSADEPSVWVPDTADRLEVNFIGSDPALRDSSETYVLDDDRLPLLVFGLLSLLRPGPPLRVAGVRVPLPRPAGLLLEKLLSERGGLKGERDLLVAVGLLGVSAPADLEELAEIYARLGREQRKAVLSSLSTVSLMKPLPQMPDPAASRARVAQLVRRLEAVG
jgi:hypothetical protein